MIVNAISMTVQQPTGVHELHANEGRCAGIGAVYGKDQGEFGGLSFVVDPPVYYPHYSICASAGVAASRLPRPPQSSKTIVRHLQF